MAYLIQIDHNNILFATDTNKLPNINIKVDYFITEVNYIEELRENAILNNIDNSIHLNGIYVNHNSLENAIDYFSKLNYKPKKILTIHSSNSGLFDKNKVIEMLSPYAKEVDVAQNNNDYILEEI